MSELARAMVLPYAASRAVARDSEGRGTFDVVLECSRSRRLIATTFAVVRSAGRIATLGVAVTNEIQVVSPSHLGEEFAWAVEPFVTKPVDIAPLVTTVVPLHAFKSVSDLVSVRMTAMKLQIAV